jgi:hypothetical protein
VEETRTARAVPSPSDRLRSRLPRVISSSWIPTQTYWKRASPSAAANGTGKRVTQRPVTSTHANASSTTKIALRSEAPSASPAQSAVHPRASSRTP